MEKFQLLPDERLDAVNEGLNLIQKKNGLTFGTDAYLLASFLRENPNASAVDLGSGTGVLSLLSLQQGKAGFVTAVEIQECFADLIRRNALLNGKEKQMTVLQKDVRELSEQDLPKSADLVISNPPYMTAGSGKRNESDEKYLARHEVAGDIFDFCQAARRVLKFGGLFVTVYRPDRMADLLSALRENGLEPKRMTFVHADRNAKPCAVLTEAKFGAAPSLTVTPPLFLYTEDSKNEKKRVLTKEAAQIYQTGKFPPL